MYALATTMLEPAPPTRFDGFEIVRPLGSGGMATVYLAHDLSLGRDVAIKIGATRNNPRGRARFALEARALGRVDHPNVVAAFHAGEIGGLPYLVTEYIPGRALNRLPTPQRWRRVLGIGVELACALEAVHGGGLLHRDVKPSNVMVRDDGQVKLIDFGLARAIDAHIDQDLVCFLELAAGSPDLRITDPDCVVGTPRYLAPELWSGRPATVQTDLYAMGLVLHELLAGSVPHGHLRGRELVAYLRTHELPLPVERIHHVPGPLVALIDACVRRRPEERPASAAVVRARLEAMTWSERCIPAGHAFPQDPVSDRFFCV